MELNWQLKKFDELTVHELYAVLHLRNEVFVVEQNCVYLDTDGKDQLSLHLMGWAGETLAAYSRIIPAGISYKEVSIGRVVTSPRFRQKGAGKLLMKTSIDSAFSHYNCAEIKIGAQIYLEHFYTVLGFAKCSDAYLEDGIPHIEMYLKK